MKRLSICFVLALASCSTQPRQTVSQWCESKGFVPETKDMVLCESTRRAELNSRRAASVAAQNRFHQMQRGSQW